MDRVLMGTLHLAAMLGLGYALRSRISINCDALSRYVMYVAMPALALESLSVVALSEGLLRAVLVYLLSMFIISSAIYLIGRAFRLQRSMIHLLILASNFSNTGFFGIPFIGSTFQDPRALQLSVMLWMTTFVLSSLLCVYLLEGLRGDERLLGTIPRILRNPIVISVILGMSLNLMSLKIPEELLYTLDSLGTTASPLALVSVGASLRASRSISARTQGVLISLRALLSPLLSLVLGSLAGLDRVKLEVLVLMSAMPAAVLLGVFSEEYDFRKEDVLPFITISSLSAPLYLNGWLLLLKHLLP